MKKNIGTSPERVVSGMRTTGALHLGNYHGALKNWLKLQHEYECFFFAADWHALTTHYDDPYQIEQSTLNLVIDWLSAGLNPNASTIFVQSHVPEHAELHLLLSMMIPLSWLERVPTYKDQQEALREKDLATYGFLGYPVLQSADILAYKASIVPVGEDQLAHLEVTREIARRFNYLYGREPGFQERIESAIAKMGKKNAKRFKKLYKEYQQAGILESFEKAQILIGTQSSLSVGEKERLAGYIEGGGRVILSQPQSMLTEVKKFPGLDGRKMSKSYGNTIALREPKEMVAEKIRVMPTDPARIRRTDPGEPTKCPVFALQELYATKEEKQWIIHGCRSAGIGCLDCKVIVIKAIQKEQEPILERSKEFESNKTLVKNILQEGAQKARDTAGETLKEVRQSMGLSH